MSPILLLTVFLALRFIQHLVEEGLCLFNHNHYLNQQNQQEACNELEISADDFQKTLAYSEDKFRFARVSEWISLLLTLGFIGLGGLGWLESQVMHLFESPLIRGLGFFAILGLLGMILGLPFEIYFTFVLEEKHGFNRQTVKQFFLDKIKVILLSILLGGLLLGTLLWVIENRSPYWWIWAWLTVSGFSLFTLYIYPTFLAPLFNRFTPLPEGELKNKIALLCEKVGFRMKGTQVMDASKRSAHGNAYFTGVFGNKRIVLFDTLINQLATNQIVAVLAHELGHFKLHHIRWGVIRSIAQTGVLFFILSLCLPLERFYHAFNLEGPSSYGVLIVFGLWFGPVHFLLQPIGSYISRRNEFSADRFAREKLQQNQLGSQLDLATAFN